MHPTKKIRISKDKAIQRIKEYYERHTNEGTSMNKIVRLISESKIPKEILELSIMSFAENDEILDDNFSTEIETLSIDVPPYIEDKIFPVLDTSISTQNFPSLVTTSDVYSKPITTPKPISNTGNYSNMVTSDIWSPSNTRIVNFSPSFEPTTSAGKFKDFYRTQTTENQNRKYAQRQINQNQDNIYNILDNVNRRQNKFFQNPLQNNTQGQQQNFNNQFHHTIEARHAIMLIPNFDGNSPKRVFEFVEKVDKIIQTVHPNQHDLLFFLLSTKLSDGAEQLTRTHNPTNWLSLKRILLDHYATKKSLNRRIVELAECKQGDLTVNMYASDLQHICSGIKYSARDENLDLNWINNLLLKTFLDGLKSELAIIVRAQRPRSFEEALNIALETEADVSIPDFKGNNRYCSFCKKTTHDTRDCRSAHKQNKSLNISETDDNSRGGNKNNSNSNYQNQNPRNQNYRSNHYPNYRNYNHPQNQQNSNNNKYNRSNNNDKRNNNDSNKNYFNNNHNNNYNFKRDNNSNNSGYKDFNNKSQNNNNSSFNKNNPRRNDNSNTASNNVHLNEVTTVTPAVVTGQH